MAELLSSPIFMTTIVILAALLLFIPISLRLAGLSGEQIVNVIALTTQFFLNLVSELRAQNKA